MSEATLAENVSSANAEENSTVIRKLFVASFLSLFVELLLIRWIPSTVHVVGFFNNLVLIGCFLGLGLGMASPVDVRTAGLRASLGLTVTVVILGIMNWLSPTIVIPKGADYGLNEITMSTTLQIPLTAVLVCIFGLVVVCAIPFGQLVSAYFDKLPRLQAYSVNIAGSLTGVLMFSLISWMSLPPYYWFAIVILALFHLTQQRRDILILAPVFVVLFVNFLQDSSFGLRTVRWSPYYKLAATPVTRPEQGKPELKDGFTVEIANQFLLSGFDLRPDQPIPESTTPRMREGIEICRSYYPFPHQLKPAKRVLVLGAGAGNDVATALRFGAEHVTAVEIDPLVMDLGRRHHPERPYQSPKVRAVVNDARAFLNTTDEKFDLILFATLDAHGLISSVGNVRLDSFIYTKESIEAAKRRLSDDGLLVLAFGPFRGDTQLRQYKTIESVFEKKPLWFLHSQNGHRVIVAGAIDLIRQQKLESVWKLYTEAGIARQLAKYPYAAIPATDDWPHLYIREKAVPFEYLTVLAGILALSVVMVLSRFRTGFRIDGLFFCMGAAFLLVETKSITEFALLVGSTWQVNSAVFTSIMIMILLANLLVIKFRRQIPIAACFVGLFVLLFLGFLMPVSAWATGGGTGRLALAGLYQTAPLFLAGIIFAATFAAARVGSVALASNLLGAVVGGTTEYLSLAYGIRSLNLLALAFYAAAFVFWIRHAKKAKDRDEDVSIESEQNAASTLNEVSSSSSPG